MPTYESERPNHQSTSPESSGVRQKKVGGGHGKARQDNQLQRQASMTREGGHEDKIRRQMHKQESKDSGIVTEMYTRPKDFPDTSSHHNKGAVSKDLASPRSDNSSSKDMPKEMTRSEKGGSSKPRRTESAKRSSSLKGSSKKRSGSLKHTSAEADHQAHGGPEESEIDLFTSKQNGSVEDMSDKKSAASIKGMWKKAVKNLKTASETKIIKKGSFIKKKQVSTESDEPEPAPSGEIDPVYSLLKCAADLPKGGPKACGVHSQCSGHQSSIRRGSPGAGGDSSGNTSKTSSPSSSASHSPKGRRKKLNARMKSFSLDTPEPSKHHLGIDEITKKKSSSFTNTCFGAGSSSPVDKYSAANLRKKFAASAKTTSLDIEDKRRGSFVPSPKESPKSQRKQSKESNTTVYVALYNFRGKEKDDMDLRAGWRLFIVDSSDPDWWKGKCNGRVGYFPAKYVIPLQFAQRVYQVTQPMHLTEGGNGMKLHKDQIVLQVGDEVENGMILVRSASNKQALCPVKYLNEV
ncbi:uncharacterized protein LOC132547048 isoform X1 [Ylistrum balloti]|uniref:uncharacterized protein LOC132547048 isoform X1 n=1 Tax=Ylistrum balloti TaxID=509963 RepID=UPI00290597A2|nr:uncharacterized protein LOC132547048 isoform X1 [Ylistrum balloti]